MSELRALEGFKPSEVKDSVDVVLIGSGAAAGPIAIELVDAGMEVMCLERGPLQKIETDFSPGNMFDELKYGPRRAMLPSTEDLFVTFRTNDKDSAKRVPYAMRTGVGGSSEHWSAQAFRCYEEDFALKSEILGQKYKNLDMSDILSNDGANVQDWPISYSDLEPFYEKIENEIGIGGVSGVLSMDGSLDRSKAKIFDNRSLGPDAEGGGNIFEAVRRSHFPFGPLRDNQIDTVFRKALLEIGLSSFHVPTAITTANWQSELGVNRSACTYCSFCTGYGCWNGSKTSIMSAIHPYLSTKKNFRIQPYSDAFRINVETIGKKKVATSVDYFDAAGKVVRQKANVVVVAAWTYQTVRILLNSGISGDATGSGKTLVGKYFINRPMGGTARITFDHHVLNGYAGPAVQRRACDHFNGENTAEYKLSELVPKKRFFLRGGLLASPSQVLPLWSSMDARPPGVPRWGKEFQSYFSHGFIRSHSLMVLRESLAYEDKFLDLDPTHKDSRGIPVCRVTNPPHENDRRLTEFMFGKAVEVLKQEANMFGGGKVYGSGEMTMVPFSTHEVGGTRMGADPANSVTNRYGQMWQIPNLFPVGGSLFPTIGGHNPTNTILALSSWIGSAIAQKCVDLNNSGAFSSKGPTSKRHRKDAAKRFESASI